MFRRNFLSLFSALPLVGGLVQVKPPVMKGPLDWMGMSKGNAVTTALDYLHRRGDKGLIFVLFYPAGDEFMRKWVEERAIVPGETFGVPRDAEIDESRKYAPIITIRNDAKGNEVIRDLVECHFDGRVSKFAMVEHTRAMRQCSS